MFPVAAFDLVTAIRVSLSKFEPETSILPLSALVAEAYTSNRLLKYPTQKCGTLLGTFDFHATLSHSELPALFEADFIGLTLVFPHFPRLTLSAHGFAPACAYA